MRWRLEGTLNGRPWRLCYAGQALAKQLDAIWPRGGVTDGTVGDAAHSVRRSDHNPKDIPEYQVDIVMALDVHETVEGQGQQLVDALVAARDPRVRYIIHEGRIWRSYDKPGIPAWTPAPYTGPNAHLSHTHISFDWGEAWDWAWVWDLSGLDEGENMQVKELVAELQAAAIRAGHDLGDFEPLDDRFPRGADGEMGDMTRRVLQLAFEIPDLTQHSHPDLSQRLAQHQHKVIEPTEWDVVTGVPI